MGQIPANNLETLNDTDHIAHHEQLHQEHNLIAAPSSRIGDVVMADSDGATGDLIARQPHYNASSQHATVDHTSSGPLTFTAERHWKSVQINASADITGATITGMDTLGPAFAELSCRLTASAAINVDLSAAGIVQGAAPTALASGEQVTFRIERWA